MATGASKPSSEGGDGTAKQSLLLESLRDPGVYDHPVGTIEVVETHISYLILTGPYAYKIKKAVALSFLDFSSLAKREFYCREEVRLNRRLAPDLYLGVIAIAGSHRRPVFNGNGRPIEFAVKMVQFDRNNELDVLLDRGEVDADLVARLAGDVAAFHDAVERVGTGTALGSYDIVYARVTDNFMDLAVCDGVPDRGLLQQLRAWVDATAAALREDIEGRRKHGFVRECHGDMHLGNMVLIGDRIRLFDCLEFNEELRWIDVISEVAFLVMDLDYRNRSDLAYHFLNRYLAATGDYAALKLLPFYLVYRSMVRAKVACIRGRQSRLTANLTEVEGHLQLARRFMRPPPARLFLTHGFSGSGKSWSSERIAPLVPAVHIRSDVERDRAVRHGAQHRDDGERYSAANIARVYDRLRELARCILDAGFSVIVDATFLKRAQRQPFIDLAGEAGVWWQILDFQCPQEVLRRRIERRLARGTDPSEADARVLEMQMRSAQALTRAELMHTVTVPGADPGGAASLAQRMLAWRPVDADAGGLR